ncbi:uncharacterized protein DS421_9g268740 [Arachis hypogaea]|nr:uncharacterized protein DS421_9g268740 [Arachis hypogaea]
MLLEAPATSMLSATPSTSASKTTASTRSPPSLRHRRNHLLFPPQPPPSNPIHPQPRRHSQERV